MARLNFLSLPKSGLTVDQIRDIAPSVFTVDKHESRTDRYHVAPTIEVLDLLLADDFKVVLAGQQRSRIAGKLNFTRHVLRLRKNGVNSIHGCFPEVVLTNSHDGSSSYRLMFGLYRNLCGTQLTVGDATIAGQKVTHSAKDTVVKVVEGANDVLAKVPELEIAMAAWQDTELTDQEQANFAKQALTLHYGKTVPPITTDEVLRSQYIEDNGSDLWSSFLRVQKNLTRGGLHYWRSSGKHKKGTTRGIKGIHRNLQFNRGLWDLAQSTHEAFQPIIEGN